MIKPIKTRKEHKQALERAYALMQKKLKADSVLSNELELLSILIEKYEEEKFDILPPDPVEAIKFRMEQLNINNSELASYLGHRSRVSEILNGKRKLTLSMIRTLNSKLKIPAESLISNY